MPMCEGVAYREVRSETTLLETTSADNRAKHRGAEPREALGPRLAVDDRRHAFRRLHAPPARVRSEKSGASIGGYRNPLSKSYFFAGS